MGSDRADWLSHCDIEQIRDLLYHYAFCIDARQVQRLREVFSTNVTASYGYGERGEWHGIDELVAGIGAQVDTFEGTAHMISNVRVEFEGERAKSTSYASGWHWMRDSGGDPERPADFLFTCVYVDDLRREPLGWRIVRRRVHRLGPSALTVGALPDHMRPAP
jgi:3-phenylpropionate/cinnamic acid dioxygenase small subunit